MSRADELLKSLSSARTFMARTIEPEIEPNIVIGSDRYITVPEELKRIAVQFDHNVETVTFDCPRYWDGLDMSKMKVYINYLRSDGEPGCYLADHVVPDDSDGSIMHFNWTITRNVTLVAGKLTFLVCIRKADDDGNEENHWNTELNKDLYVSEGLEYDGEILEELMPDIVEQWHRRVLDTVNAVEAVATDLLEARDSGELNGATFVPSLSDEGELSWTNDKGFENPEPVNIRGATFTPSVTEEGDLSWTNDKGLENPATVNIHGANGVSPTIKVTDISGGHRVTITDVNGSKYFDVMDTIIEPSEAVTTMMNNFVFIGETEPTSGPVIWFDTTDDTETATEAVILEIGDDADETNAVANVEGTDYPVTNLSDAIATDDANTYEFQII